MTQVTIAATTDVHGYLNEGLTALPAVLEAVGANILIDNGDFFVGSPFAAYAFDQLAVSPLVTVANRLNYDVMVPGNHDLDFGLAWLKKQVSALEADFICANLKDADGVDVFPSYSIQSVSDVKVAVVGLMTAAFNQLCPLEVSQQVIIENPFAALKKVLKQLKANTVAYDLLLVSYHGGLTNDPQTGATWFYPSIEDQAYQLMTTFPEIDSLICGHQHFTNTGIHPQGTALLQAGSRAHYLGLQRFEVENESEAANQSAASRVKIIENRLLDLRAKATKYPLGPLHEPYLSWLEKTVTVSDIQTWVKQRYPADCYMLDFKARNFGELMAELMVPFPLSYYYAPGKEIMAVSDAYETLEAERFYSTLAITGCLPQSRLREGLLLPLFDEIIKQQAD